MFRRTAKEMQRAMKKTKGPETRVSGPVLVAGAQVQKRVFGPTNRH
jgi:hypothetical protein